MKQVVQALSGGPVEVLDIPVPTIGPTEVLVRTRCSIISAGTEHAVTALAQSNLLKKAKARPDLVRQVVNKAKTQGVLATATAVRAKMAGYLPLGYSACGVVEQVGEHVEGIAVGQLVATGGAGKANHAEYQAVPAMLCVPVPDGVDETEAAFATVASIALHGLRLGDIEPGSYVVVIGLGLIGQLACRLAAAAGALVAGIDVADFPLQRATEAGTTTFKEEGPRTTAAIKRWSSGRGADCVIVAAGTASSAIMARVPELCRDRASVVVVGDVGLELDRRPYYERELTIRFARSYGPGRYEYAYEDLGIDYPAGQVRFTEGRNLETVLKLLAAGRLRLADLVTQTFEINDAAAAYRLIDTKADPFLAVRLTYGHQPEAPDRPPPQRRRRSAGDGIGLIGAGAFATTVLIPAFKKAGADNFVAVASASGLAARAAVDNFGFERAVSGADAVIEDPKTSIIVICTPHDTHAALVAKALRAGKDVYCEKPLALTMEELCDVEQAWRESRRTLHVGFNRRHSQAVAHAKSLLGTARLVINYRVNAGPIPDNHWYRDRRQGGRLLGEVCHFIDTCGALADAAPSSIYSVTSVCEDGSDNWCITIGYPNGSLAAITYSSNANPHTPKERIEIHGSTQTVIIDDFRTVEAGPRRSVRISDDPKGHRSSVAHFLAVRVTADAPDPNTFATPHATLQAALSPPIRIDRAGQ